MASAPPNAVSNDHTGLGMSRNGVRGGTVVREEDLEFPRPGPLKIGGVPEQGGPLVREFTVDIRNATKEQTQEADQYAFAVVGHSTKREARQERARVRYQRLNELVAMSQQPPPVQNWGQPYAPQQPAWTPQPQHPGNYSQSPPQPQYPIGYGPPGQIQGGPPQVSYTPAPAPVPGPYGPPPQQSGAPPAPTIPRAPVPPQIVAPSHQITFFFPGAGPLQMYFHRVEVQRAGLYLIWDKRFQPAPPFLADQLEGPIVVRVAGLHEDLEVEATGLVLDFEQYVISTLLITGSSPRG